MDNDDPRCCGSGTCIINADGWCWCGQRWNGATMCRPGADEPTKLSVEATQPDAEGDAS